MPDQSLKLLCLQRVPWHRQGAPSPEQAQPLRALPRIRDASIGKAGAFTRALQQHIVFPKLRAAPPGPARGRAQAQARQGPEKHLCPIQYGQRTLHSCQCIQAGIAAAPGQPQHGCAR